MGESYSLAMGCSSSCVPLSLSLPLGFFLVANLLVATVEVEVEAEPEPDDNEDEFEEQMELATLE